MWVLWAVLCYNDLSFDVCWYVPISFQTDDVETSDETYSANAAMKIDLPDTYELLEYLGKGCFGVVAKCQKVDTGQIVAIKFPLGRGDDNEVGYVYDFGGHSCKRYCIVNGAVSAMCKKAISFI